MKRKTRQPKQPCPNPLFLMWLEEWREDAREKGLKSEHTFSKAINSLKKYPIPLRSGKEASILEGIGPNIAKRLDKALESYYEDNPDEMLTSFGSFAIPGSIPVPPSLLNSLPAELPEAGKKKKVGGPSREYVPGYRTGAYALIMALYNATKKSSYCGYVNKDNLQKAAQPMSETSFTLPDPGSHYTAWSSMGTLIKKGLVIKTSNPARYSITDAGCALAAKLTQANSGLSSAAGNDGCPIPTGATNKSRTKPAKTSRKTNKQTQVVIPQYDEPRLPSLDTQDDYFMDVDSFDPLTSSLGTKLNNNYTGMSLKHSLADRLRVPGTDLSARSVLVGSSTVTSLSKAGESSYTGQGKLEYWYINTDGKYVRNKDDAVVTIGDDIPVGFLIKCKRSALQNSGIRYKIDSRCSEGDFIYAYIHDDDAFETCSPLPALQESGFKQNTAGKQDDCLDLTQSSDDEDDNLSTAIKQSLIDTCTVYQGENDKQAKQSSMHHSKHTPESKSMKFTPEFIFRPGTFDIILCVDVVETTGGSNSARKEVLLKELNNNAVNCTVRKLQLGDFLWIAKERLSPAGLTHRELVLDYIVERKRMDDLSSSIIDGRFKEQKFRLRSCGLKKPIYLVEEFGSSKHLSIPYQTLQQAITNTQVTDGFFVKQTSDTKESAAYLTLMTRQLQKLYSCKTLASCPKKYLSEVDNSITSDTCYQMIYEEFHASTEKNRVLTVGELFIKQLMQIKGMSADRVISIVDKYPTPKSLLNAYDRIQNEKDKELLLAQLKCGKLQRNLGQVLSRHVYLLYTGIKGSLSS